MDQQTFLFWVIAAMTGLSAICVVVTQNIVRSAAWLLFTLGGTAGIFFLMGADFVGATQLIVYVGGILVLVVFGVMLTAQGPFVTMRAGANTLCSDSFLCSASKSFTICCASACPTDQWSPGDVGRSIDAPQYGQMTCVWNS